MKLLSLLLSVLCLYAVRSENLACHHDAANKMDLINMSIDCKLLILENLELKDLINISMTNKHFWFLAKHVYKRKFGRKTLQIHIQAGSTPITFFRNSTMISDLNLANQILETFGDEIEKIEFNFKHMEHEYQIENLVRKINEFSSNSLISLEMQECRGNPFKEINVPFKRMEDIRFSGQLTTLRSEHLTFSELFPRLRKIDVAFLEVLEPESIEQVLPDLESLDVSFSNNVSFNQANIQKLFEKNSQVTSLHAFSVTPDFLTIVSQYLPNIDKLGIDILPRNSTTISGNVKLESVTEAIIFANQFVSPSQMEFGNLLKLQVILIGMESVSDDWIDFILNNTHLTNIKMLNALLNNEQLAKIDRLPQLRDAHLSCSSNVSIDTIVTFLQSSNKAEVFLSNVRQSILKTLRVTLGDRWRVVIYSDREFADAYFIPKKLKA